MSILFPVPWVTQLKKGAEDPTGCWYASACMVGYFFEAGPRKGVPLLFSRPLSDGRLGHHATGSTGANGAAPTHNADLAATEGFMAVKNCSTAHEYTLNEIEELLTERGPIFMYWFKKNGGPVHRIARASGDDSYGHASVIVGTTTSEIIYHDPEYILEHQGANRKMSLDNFNKSRQYWQWALMQKTNATRFKVAQAAARGRA